MKSYANYRWLVPGIVCAVCVHNQAYGWATFLALDAVAAIVTVVNRNLLALKGML